MSKLLSYVKGFSFLLCLMSVSSSAWATMLTCVPYKDDPSNTLRAVNVFNARYIDDKEIGDLPPTHETQNGNILTQFWDVSAYRKPKLFFICFYKNSTYENEKESTITTEIPKSIDMCKLIRPYRSKIPTTIAVSFSCFQAI